uniref:Uncharacterized protein n=1 Tax=Lepeophtheirus salmonis TaxID=72036 RepID=A0A0K2T4X2_LEPSM
MVTPHFFSTHSIKHYNKQTKKTAMDNHVGLSSS